MLYRNYLFLSLFLVGLAQNTVVFAEKSWFQQINDTFYNGIKIHKTQPAWMRPVRILKTTDGQYGANPERVSHCAIITPNNATKKNLRKPFFHLRGITKYNSNDCNYYLHWKYYLMPGDCILAATLLGTAAFGYYKYFHNKG